MRLATAMLVLFTATGVAQHEPPATQQPAPTEAPRDEQPRRQPKRPTHAPQLEFAPLDAWHHIRRGNDAAVAARQRRESLPPPAPRPAGAGRHVCAVIVCADCSVDVPALLGLPRQDVLLISTPGPFVPPEVLALLEQAVAQERLSLVLLLSHTHCTTLDTKPGATPQQDAMAQRINLVRAEAERTRVTLPKALLLGQRERLLAASDDLRRLHALDKLRVMPGELDIRTGAITWHTTRSDEMLLPPVR